jgi:pyridoxal phosphate enzyme (YggS family)
VALSADVVRANLEQVRAEIGRDDVEIIAAVKYVELEDLAALAEAGITHVGENRAQELARKSEAFPQFTWDFIGQLQSRKVKAIAPLVRCIHSVGSDSAIAQLAKLEERPQLLVQVNIAGEEGKAGFAPDDLPRVLDRLDFDGLMVMPPLADRPEDSRRWFAAARELAERHGLRQLSMGTTQDFVAAVEEGATRVRIGSRLYGEPDPSS